ncbi:MAG TPA: AI-2E family transporter [Gaiellaceae bacterium]|nr:AI-2E family transporter [Gaiellaceae bacterium]
MSVPRGPAIRIPRWVQLVGLPVLLVLGYFLAGALGHALFLFLTASVIAFLLNPLVRDLQRLRLRRGLAVTVVFLLFFGLVGVGVAGVATVAVDQTRSASTRIEDYFTVKDRPTGKTGAEHDIDRLQAWLDRHHLERIRVEDSLTNWADSIKAKDITGYTKQVFSFAKGAARTVILGLFSLILIVVISIYMLLDFERLEGAVDRRFPPHGGPPLTRRIERALAGYVRGQLILSTVIGTSAGVGTWLLGVTGLVPGADRYALLFGLWTAFIEVIPYIGPWLSAVPPAVYALVVDPIGVLWVAALFVFIYQVEGHVVVPNVMANALRLHPLLVIFGLLAGGELYGLPGVLLALPTMAALRAIWDFFGERVELEPWQEGEQLPLELDVEQKKPRAVSGG